MMVLDKYYRILLIKQTIILMNIKYFCTTILLTYNII